MTCWWSAKWPCRSCLLVAAGLMIRTLGNLRLVDPGFDAQSVATMSISVPPTKFATPEQQISFFNRVLERVRTLPGVQTAGLIDDLPLSCQRRVASTDRDRGTGCAAHVGAAGSRCRLISTGYMNAMRIPVVRGRDFNDADVAGRPAAILISESMAKRFWPNEDAIGKHLTISFTPGVVREVVGIVERREARCAERDPSECDALRAARPGDNPRRREVAVVRHELGSARHAAIRMSW